MSFQFLSLWRRLLTYMESASGKAKKRLGNHRKAGFRLRVEELEPHIAPTVSIVNVPPNVTVADYRMDMTGVNANETILTPANVNTASFGKIWDNEQIQGQIYAQPIYLPNLTVNVNGVTQTQDTLFVATEANMLYWVNADTGAIIQSIDFDDYGLAGATTVTPVPSQDVGEGSLLGAPTTNTQIYPQIGITSTPVYANGLLYVVAYKKEMIPGRGRWSIMSTIWKRLMSAPPNAASLRPRLPTRDSMGIANYTFFAGPSEAGKWGGFHRRHCQLQCQAGRESAGAQRRDRHGRQSGCSHWIRGPR